MLKKISCKLFLARLIFIFCLALFSIASALYLMKNRRAVSPGVNIVLICIDTLRADHLPFYGYDLNTAPFLTELASKSAVFDKAYTVWSATTPSVASLFTSLYPFQHGVFRGFSFFKRAEIKADEKSVTRQVDALSGSYKTLAEVLKEQGYKTYGISDNVNVNKEMGFARGFDEFVFRSYDSASTISEILIDLKKEIVQAGKYFLYIHFMDPHAPYYKRMPWFSEFARKRELDENDSNQVAKYSPGGPWDPFKAVAYDSEIRYLDEWIGNLFETFQWDHNTLFILIADHGEEFWEHGRTDHNKTLYNEVLHIPMMVYYSEGGISGKRISQNVSIIDILPTLANFSGSGKDKKYEGIDLLPMIKGKTEKARKLFAVLNFKPKNRYLKSTIYKEWKYISTWGEGEELFNLETDFGEKENLTGKYPQRAAQMLEWYDDNEKNCEKYLTESSEYEMTKSKMEHLKSLGYL